MANKKIIDVNSYHFEDKPSEMDRALNPNLGTRQFTFNSAFDICQYLAINWEKERCLFGNKISNQLENDKEFNYWHQQRTLFGDASGFQKYRKINRDFNRITEC